MIPEKRKFSIRFDFLSEPTEDATINCVTNETETDKTDTDCVVWSAACTHTHTYTQITHSIFELYLSSIRIVFALCYLVYFSSSVHSVSSTFIYEKTTSNSNSKCSLLPNALRISVSSSLFIIFIGEPLYKRIMHCLDCKICLHFSLAIFLLSFLCVNFGLHWKLQTIKYEECDTMYILERKPNFRISSQRKLSKNGC